MSVMLLTNNHFAICQNSITKFSNAFNYQKPILTFETRDYFKTLKRLNEMSYLVRYKDEEILSEPFKENNNYFDNIYQLIKALQCIRCNIELDNKELQLDKFEFEFEYKNVIDWLNQMIDRLTLYVIQSSQEYKNANWSIAG